MKKISTLFKKDPNDLGRVINEINPENQWVFDGFGIPTRKYDGTACAIIDGQLYKRYDVKKGKPVPEYAIACQEPDAISGHWPHWVLCNHDDPQDKYHFEAFYKMGFHQLGGDTLLQDGTYELIGEKINGNKEEISGHKLIRHGNDILKDLSFYDFDSIKDYLYANDIEGVVFHHKEDKTKMCKIRKSDFGIKR